MNWPTLEAICNLRYRNILLLLLLLLLLPFFPCICYSTSSHAADSDGDDDDEPGEVEKCFICNKFISKSLYQAHVQNELDRMDASNNSQVESTSSPSKNTRQSVAVGSENSDAIPSAVSTSTSSSTRRQILSTAATEGSSTGGVSRSRSGNAAAAAQGTRGALEGDDAESRT